MRKINIGNIKILTYICDKIKRQNNNGGNGIEVKIKTPVMEKLTEKINSFNISKSMKDNIKQIAYDEQIHIQQVCRKLLDRAIKDYISSNKEKRNTL